MCKKCYLILTRDKHIYSCPFCRQKYKNNTYNNNYKTDNKQNNNESHLEIPLINSRLNKNRIRKRRKNLSLEEIKARRDNIRKRCNKKWNCKNNRLNKLKWYDIN